MNIMNFLFSNDFLKICKKPLKKRRIPYIIIKVYFNALSRKNGKERMKKNICIKIAYDGSRYNGWQRQENTEKTIQGKLEAVFAGILGEPIELKAAGRTDAGVHAKGQMASFHMDSDMDLNELMRLANHYLPEDIAVLSIKQAGERFHARLNARGKLYEYVIWNSPVPDVFGRKYEYILEEPLNLAAMREAAECLIGEHDFRSFCSNRRMKKSTVRTIYSIQILEEGDRIRIQFHGNGFLYNMVRILTGTLIEAGLLKKTAGQVKAALEARDREQAGFTAPPQGLCLLEVYY